MAVPSTRSVAFLLRKHSVSPVGTAEAPRIVISGHRNRRGGCCRPSGRSAAAAGAAPVWSALCCPEPAGRGSAALPPGSRSLRSAGAKRGARENADRGAAASWLPVKADSEGRQASGRGECLETLGQLSKAPVKTRVIVPWAGEVVKGLSACPV